MSLPAELLEIIFEFCHPRPQAVGSYVQGDTSLSDALRNFPYNLAGVDPSWEAILLRHREYWTGLPHIVLNVDSKSPTHIDDAKKLLRYMFDTPPDRDTHYHPFHVALIQRSKENENDNPDDAAEKERVKQFMDLLRPEIRHFRSFLIDVHASSSLPSPATYFNNLMTSPLIRLEYLCDVDDSHDAVLHEVSHYGLPAQSSHITSMVLDGYNFRRNTVIGWLRGHTMLKSLTISRLSDVSTDQRGILYVYSALEAMHWLMTGRSWGASATNLTRLKFRNINPAPSSRSSMLYAFAMFMRLLRNNVSVRYISFEDVDPWFLEDLTRSIHMDTNQDNPDFDPSACGTTTLDLHFVYGASSRDIPVNTVQAWKSARLILEGYDKTHLTSSYPFDQATFPSSELHLINCAGFTDSELKILSRVNPETKTPLFCTNLKYLKITSCHKFTIQALKDMVAARALNCQRRSGMAGWKKRRLDSLEVNGYSSPLSEKDKYWFIAHVKNVSWDGSPLRRK